MLHGVALAAAGAALLLVGAGAAGADELKVGGMGAAQGLLQRLGEAFAARHPEDAVEVVPGLGSSGGISAVAEGVLHLSVSGRPLKEEEKAKGLDGIPLLDTPYLFVTSHANPQRLTKAEVVAIYDGALTKWPDGKEIKPILRPKSDSVTPFLIASFEGMQAAMDTLRQRPDVPVAATDQDNIQAAERTAGSFAGATLTQAVTETPRLRRIPLDGVDASVEAMETGAYPLKMRLHAVVRSDRSPAVRRFVAFLHSPAADRIIRESGGAMVAPKPVPAN